MKDEITYVWVLKMHHPYDKSGHSNTFVVKVFKNENTAIDKMSELQQKSWTRIRGGLQVYYYVQKCLLE